MDLKATALELGRCGKTKKCSADAIERALSQAFEAGEKAGKVQGLDDAIFWHKSKRAELGRIHSHFPPCDADAEQGAWHGWAAMYLTTLKLKAAALEKEKPE